MMAFDYDKLPKSVQIRIDAADREARGHTPRKGGLDAAAKARTTTEAVLEGVDANRDKRRRLNAPPGNKYGAVRTTVDGISFASKAEAEHYSRLCVLQKVGEVAWFCRQPRFVLPGGVEYVADFIVGFTKDGPGFKVLDRIDIQDVKGFATPEYNLKKRQVEAIYGIKITEIRNGQPTCAALLEGQP